MMPGDGAVWPAMVMPAVADDEIRGQANRARDFEDADARGGAVDAFLEGTRAAGVDVRDPVNPAATAGRRFHAEACARRESPATPARRNFPGRGRRRLTT